MDRQHFVFWSYPLFRLFGTEVRISWMLPLIAPLYAVMLGWQLGLVLAVLVMLAVLIHEFGHVFVARWTGGHADEIVLWPFGGLAMAQPGPGVSSQMLTASSGPAVNFLLCVALFPGWYAPELLGRAMIPLVLPIDQLSAETILVDLALLAFTANYQLMLINLLPVIPFDGGQVLQAFLASRLPQDRVYRGMTYAGFAAAVLLMLAGLLAELPGLIVIGAIVLAVNILQSTQAGAGAFQDESFMGYDFSQGYTSLERSAGHDDAEPRASSWQQWKARRQAQKEEQARQRQQQDEAQLDALLAKVHEQGYGSLSSAEKRLLERVSSEYRLRPKRSASDEI